MLLGRVSHIQQAPAVLLRQLQFVALLHLMQSVNCRNLVNGRTCLWLFVDDNLLAGRSGTREASRPACLRGRRLQHAMAQQRQDDMLTML